MTSKQAEQIISILIKVFEQINKNVCRRDSVVKPLLSQPLVTRVRLSVVRPLIIAGALFAVRPLRIMRAGSRVRAIYTRRVVGENGGRVEGRRDNRLDGRLDGVVIEERARQSNHSTDGSVPCTVSHLSNVYSFLTNKKILKIEEIELKIWKIQ